ncbi:hypothetical protein AB0I54_27620 [Streptomyces sp. NPDC050625]|uniref:hypothetical protein n=1 Tax=Streptomyces sp. NPDC050625 TaxID=3154629 RepID=UPI003443B14D
MGSSPHTHELLDISKREDLIRYAVASHLARLKAGANKVTSRVVASVMRTRQDRLSHCLQGAERFSDAELRRFDLAMTTLGLERSGGLSALAVRLRGTQDQRDLLDAHTPASLHEGLLRQQPIDEGTVLHQADALVSQLQAASELGKPVPRERKDQIKRVVRSLILIGAAPPTRLNVEALIWLGTLSGYVFDEMADQLEQAVRSTPLGFRVWRALTKSVLLSTSRSAHADEQVINALGDCVRMLLDDAEELRQESLYPGRSLDLELAIAVPGDWSDPSGPDGDWVGAMLLERARSRDATLRERGTAAHGLWQRAVQGRGLDRDTVREQLGRLIEVFENPGDRPDIATGLRWTAATLRVVLDADTEVCNTWPATDEPWFARVMEAATSLETTRRIPQNLRTATRRLFEHALLQNAGVVRRQAIDTIVAAGWGEPVADALIKVLKREQQEPWLRIRALFALGFLQEHGPKIQDALVAACLDADRRLKECARPAEQPAVVTELHAALFSVGDCFGARGTEATARAVRERLRPLLDGLVTEKDRLAARETWPVARAAAYLLTVTAQNGPSDLAEGLLEELERHDDPVTAALSTWAGRFRFDRGSHRVRPLLAAARLGPEGTYRDDTAETPA